MGIYTHIKVNKPTLHALHVALLIVLILSTVLSLFSYPPVIYASETDTFYSSASDGFNNQIFASPGTSYDTVRDWESNSPMDSSSTSIVVGQRYQDNPGDDPGYFIWRGYLFFDTSAIPDDAIISSATLKLYGAPQSPIDRDIFLLVTEGMPTYPHDPLTITDYNRLNYNTDYLASIYSSGWTAMGYNSLVFSSSYLGVINKAGTTKFCLRSARDVSSSGYAPSASEPNEYVIFYSANREGTNYDPKLEITYTVPVVQVEVITQDADTISETGARLRGQVTEDGNSPCTVWFEYGLTDSYGVSTSPKEGYWEGSEFADFITGLQRGQLYYYRAMASNGETTGNGTQKTFFTYPAKPTNLTATAGDTHIYLTWTKGDGAQKTMVRYLTTGSYPQSPTDGTQAYFDTGATYNHTSLDNETTYAYSAWSWATEGGLDEYSTSYITAFATPREDTTATVITYDASAVAQDSAALHGYLSSLGGYGYVEVSFQWYKDGGTWTDHETTPEYQYTPGLFDADISGLDADSLYYFRAKGENGAGITYGASNSFTTGAISAPTITTLPATALTKTSATIHGIVSNDGGASVTAWFEWGTTIPYEYTSSTTSGLVTNSLLQLNLDELELNTTYHYRFVGTNYYGEVLRTGYGSDVTFITLAPSLPTVTTQIAVVGASSATLNGFLVDDGGAECEVRFQWYAEDETIWENESGWQSGKNSNDLFSVYITNLDIGKTYYYHAQARNNDEIASGETRSFTVEFSPPVNFIATAISSSVIELTWTLGGDQTYIVMKPTGYSANRTDGTLIYFGGNNIYIHIELDPGETYYYRGWSWLTGGNFTVDYSDVLATTLAPGAGEQEPPAIIVAPDKPSRWDAKPDPSALNGTIFYTPINDLADAIGIPQGTFWLLLAVLISVLVGLGVYMLAHSAVIAAIAMGLALLSGWWLFIVPLWMIAVMGTMSTGVIYLEKRL